MSFNNSTKLDEVFDIAGQGGVELKLTAQETSDMLDVLNFTYDTLLFLIKEEQLKGSKAAAAKLDRYFLAAESLLIKIHNTLNMVGVPPKSECH